jgi:hypothetical protein
MNDEFEFVLGSGNPFRDVGIPDADIELMKATLRAASSASCASAT